MNTKTMFEIRCNNEVKATFQAREDARKYFKELFDHESTLWCISHESGDCAPTPFPTIEMRERKGNIDYRMIFGVIGYG